MKGILKKIEAVLAAVAFAEEGGFETVRQIVNEKIYNGKEATMKILVAYDGTLSAKAALQHGILRAKAEKSTLIVLSVFNRNLFVDYDGGPYAEETAREESARSIEEATRIIDEASLDGQDIRKRIFAIDGNPEEEIVRIAKEQEVDIIISPHSFGAVAKIGICPVYLMPPGALPAAIAL